MRESIRYFLSGKRQVESSSLHHQSLLRLRELRSLMDMLDSFEVARPRLGGLPAILERGGGETDCRPAPRRGGDEESPRRRGGGDIESEARLARRSGGLGLLLRRGGLG